MIVGFEKTDLGHRLVVALALLHRKVGVGERRDLWEVGHDEHLVPIAEVAERATDGETRLSPDAGVDLVEHEDGWGLRQHAPQGQHRPSQLAARRHLRQRLQWGTRVGCEQERHLTPIRAVDLDAHVRLGHGQVGEVRSDRLGQPGCGRAAGVEHVFLCGPEGVERRPSLPIKLGRDDVVVFELLEPQLERITLGDHRRHVVAVLPAQVVKQTAPGLHLLEGFRVLLDALADRTAWHRRCRRARPRGRGAGAVTSANGARPSSWSSAAAT